MDENQLRHFALALERALKKRVGKIAEGSKHSANARFPKRQLFIAFNQCKDFFADHFGVDVHSCKSRWSTGPRKTEISKKKKTPSEAVKQDDIRVIEYLVDYCLSAFAIPQAIKQKKPGLKTLTQGENYRLLLAVESEMGDDEEVARDFLKLLDVKSPVKCLVFDQRSPALRKRLFDRIEWVISHHYQYNPRERLLIVGLPRPKIFRKTEIDFWQVRRRKVIVLKI